MRVIADLQTSVAIYQETSHAERTTSLALVASRPRLRSTPAPPWHARKFQNTLQKCMVYRNSGYWSPNHPEDKRMEVLRENNIFRALIADLFDGGIKDGINEPIHTDDFDIVEPLDHL